MSPRHTATSTDPRRAPITTPRVAEVRSLEHLDDAIEYVDAVLAQPRGAALRAPMVTTAVAIAVGVEPSVAHRLHADRWVRELLAAHRVLLAAALKPRHAAFLAAVRPDLEAAVRPHPAGPATGALAEGGC